MGDDLRAYLPEHEREKVVSVLNWVVWDFQLLFWYFLFLSDACFTLPRRTRQPLQGCITDALVCASWTVGCRSVFQLYSRCGCSRSGLQYWDLSDTDRGSRHALWGIS